MNGTRKPITTCGVSRGCLYMVDNFTGWLQRSKSPHATRRGSVTAPIFPPVGRKLFPRDSSGLLLRGRLRLWDEGHCRPSSCGAQSVSQHAHTVLLTEAHNCFCSPAMPTRECLKPTPCSFLYFIELCLLFSVCWEESINKDTGKKADESCVCNCRDKMGPLVYDSTFIIPTCILLFGRFSFLYSGHFILNLVHFLTTTYLSYRPGLGFSNAIVLVKWVLLVNITQHFELSMSSIW